MRARSHVLFAAALVLGLCVAVPADAQQHRATRLGEPAHRFAPPLRTPQDLRELFRDEALKRDIAAILEQVRWPGDVEDLRRAAAQADVAAVKLPRGSRLPFMSSRDQGKPVALVDVLWDGPDPISAYEFEFVSRGRRYRCVTPKPCSNFYVVDLGPLAAVELSNAAPREASMCEPFEFSMTVRNTGGSPLSNVQVSDPLPAGLKATDGQTTLTLDVGTLAPGEGRQIHVRVVASGAGTYQNRASVRCAEGVTAEAEATIVIRAPAIAVECTAPPSVLPGRPGQLCIAIRNTGDGAEPKLSVALPIPAGATVPNATEGGVVADGRVTWEVRNLAAGESRRLCATVTAAAPGSLVFEAAVAPACAAPVLARCETRVAGVQGVLLEVVDLEDPVEVDHEVTYEVRVVNQGSAALTNIRLAGSMPDSQQFVSGSGATEVKGAERTATTEPLATLEPKAEATWRVVVKALKQADARFKIDLTADQFPQPVEEYEATSQY